MVRILPGDCREVLRTLPDASVNCVVTSPPYWGLRDYGVAGQIGMEESPDAYVERMVDVFREVWRVLRPDGTCWVNMGDTYAAGKPRSQEACAKGGMLNSNAQSKLRGGQQVGHGSSFRRDRAPRMDVPHRAIPRLKPKDIVGMPWRLAFALQADGWYLRQDIIWSKPNPMPESVDDRCTKAHEYIFLLTKAVRYYFNQKAILEPVSPNTHARLAQNVAAQIGSERANGGTRADRPMKAECRRPKAWDQDMGSYRTLVQGQPRKPNGWHNSETYHGTNPVRLRDVGVGDGRRPRKAVPNGRYTKNNASFDEAMAVMPILRNKRSVWTVPTAAYSGAHFATFPPALIRPCILAGCPQGGTVLDPFAGTGTTGEVAEEEGRHSILIELNPAYVEMAKRRTAQGGLFCQAAGGAS